MIAYIKGKPVLDTGKGACPVATVFDVANYFLCRSGETGELLTNLKLQKLVYYAQAWHLAVFGSELFPEDFEAWVHGPVCPNLYHSYKGFGWNPIPCVNDRPKFAQDTADLIEQVVELYLGESAYTLERMTHGEAPWIKARNGLPPDAPSNAIVTKDSMKEYYRQYVIRENPS